ncbi:hypothetical protein ACIQRS_12645 [Streptomyces termitum]|uniref:hypothetical protein n=1 Tax=Streptomyces termitum TaxID=67368 RepID=UPI0027E462CE|nr:hypothetical protein [Streptomyces termitum]
MLAPASTRRSAAIVVAALAPPMECPAMPIRRASMVRAWRQAGRGPVSRSRTNRMSAARVVVTTSAGTPCSSRSAQATQSSVSPPGRLMPYDS